MKAPEFSVVALEDLEDSLLAKLLKVEKTQVPDGELPGSGGDSKRLLRRIIERVGLRQSNAYGMFRRKEDDSII